MVAKMKSTEFWLSIIAIIVGALMGAGVFGDGSIYSKCGGWIIAALASSGYTMARTLAKAADGASKPGYKTTEFWKAAAAAVIVWLQVHVIPAGSQWAELLGYAASILPIGAYAVSRGALKGSVADAVSTANAMLLPFLFFGLVLSSCATGYNARYGDCMKKRGKVALAEVETGAKNIATSGMTASQIAAAMKGYQTVVKMAAPYLETGVDDAIECAVQALSPSDMAAPMSSPPPAPILYDAGAPISASVRDAP